MREFGTLRQFALNTIPTLLKERGGCMDKATMHAHIEREYLQGRPMPEELQRINGAGCRAARNSIAWAMSQLVVRRVLLPSAGRPIVCLVSASRATSA
jgi:hypothetical protein